MSSTPSFDAAAAHRFFSAHCFNQGWNLIDKPDRTSDDDEQLLLLAHASLWHWTQREDCSPRNLSIGYWQLARIYALLGRSADARQAGERCLRHAEKELPFFIAYGHEALARAAAVSGDAAGRDRHLKEAERLAALVEDAEERTALEADLRSIISA
jgi:hypothetical protein